MGMVRIPSEQESKGQLLVIILDTRCSHWVDLGAGYSAGVIESVSFMSNWFLLASESHSLILRVIGDREWHAEYVVLTF